MYKNISKLIFASLLFSACSTSVSVEPGFKPEKKYLKNETYEYLALVEAYKNLAEAHPNAALIEIGETDHGLPLLAYILSSFKSGSAENILTQNEETLVVLINNGIHPGEPCGIDASLHFAYDLQENFEAFKKEHPNTLLAIIPTFNIGGALNRSCCSRANQNGPLAYGFRGNSKNLDLNRDFMKADAKETSSLQKFMVSLNPDLFVDTHSTNGADYPYIMTLISSQPDKAGKILEPFYRNVAEPFLYNAMLEKDFETIPYVSVFGTDPRNGYAEFSETPRYTTGFTTLFQTIGFVSEAHMFKPYKERVESTYAFFESVLAFGSSHKKEIKETRKEALNEFFIAEYTPIKLALNKDSIYPLPFKGYTMVNQKSPLTGLDSRYFDANLPYQDTIKHYRKFEVVDSVLTPKYYIIPNAWQEIIAKLNNVNIESVILNKDSLITCNQYYIENYKTASKPYEGHYLHYDIETRQVKKEVLFSKGSILINLNQKGIRYLIEALEPRAVDSFFAWGFFDAILQQKEYYSDYAFELKAIEWLKENPDVKIALEQAKVESKELANSHRAQLDFIYKRSPWYEKTANLYPIGIIY